MQPNQTPRILTHDERKAADAAFAGRAFDPSWSDSARRVYDGILAAQGLPEPVATPGSSQPAKDPGVTTTGQQSAALPSGADPSPHESGGAPDSSPAASQPRSFSRDEAILAGALIDVTPIAHKLGLRIPVTFSRPLWEAGITASKNIPEEEVEGRVRDVLMAFQLKLAASRIASPLVEFPAMLAFPPDPVPHTCLLFAVAHQEANAQMALTFLLPGEVSTGITPFSAGE